MEGQSFGGERQWRPAVWSSIRPGLGSIELVEGRNRCGAGLGRFWREETARDDELWPARRAAAHCTGSAQSELEQEEEGE